MSPTGQARLDQRAVYKDAIEALSATAGFGNVHAHFEYELRTVGVFEREVDTS